MASNNHLNPKKVGKRIRERRLEVGVSQRELAQDGVTYAYISRLENGGRTPSFSALVALADRLRELAAREAAKAEAQARLAEVDPHYAGANSSFAKHASRLRAIEAETTALYLLTGSTHDTCPFCGRHEQGATTDGKDRPRRSRH